MIIVNYKSKRELKKAIGKGLECIHGGTIESGKPFFVTNGDNTFNATVIIVNGKITSVR